MKESGIVNRDREDGEGDGIGKCGTVGNGSVMILHIMPIVVTNVREDTCRRDMIQRTVRIGEDKSRSGAVCCIPQETYTESAPPGHFVRSVRIEVGGVFVPVTENKT